LGSTLIFNPVRLHLTLLAPLEGARLDANAGGALIAAGREYVVGAPDQLGGGIKATADEPHCRIAGYSAALAFAVGET